MCSMNTRDLILSNLNDRRSNQECTSGCGKFAKDSESELGKIRHANQGQFTITDRDANTPYIKKVRVVTTIDYSLED